MNGDKTDSLVQLKIHAPCCSLLFVLLSLVTPETFWMRNLNNMITQSFIQANPPLGLIPHSSGESGISHWFGALAWSGA